MDSKDIVITINGQEYRVEGSVLKPVSNNFQQEVLKRLDGIESRLGAVETEQKAMRSELQAVHDEQLVLRTRVDMLIYGGSIGFALLCAVIAWVSLFAPRFWDRKKDTQSEPSTALQPIVINVPAYSPQSEQKSA